MFFSAEPKKTGENFRETVARRIVAASFSVEGSESFRKGDLVVGQLVGRGLYLVRFDVIDTAWIGHLRSKKIIQGICSPFDTLVIDGLPTDKINETF